MKNAHKATYVVKQHTCRKLRYRGGHTDGYDLGRSPGTCTLFLTFKWKKSVGQPFLVLGRIKSTILKRPYLACKKDGIVSGHVLEGRNEWMMKVGGKKGSRKRRLERSLPNPYHISPGKVESLLFGDGHWMQDILTCEIHVSLAQPPHNLFSLFPFLYLFSPFPLSEIYIIIIERLPCSFFCFKVVLYILINMDSPLDGRHKYE